MTQETVGKQIKSTKLVIALQNWCRDIVDKKLEKALQEADQANRKVELIEIKSAKFENEFKQA